jgi:hypothetical protein
LKELLPPIEIGIRRAIMQLFRLQDDVMVQHGRRTLDSEALAGRWVNTNAHGRGVCEFQIDIDDGRVKLRPFSMAGKSFCAWGTAEADLICGSSADSTTAMSFTAPFEHGPYHAEFQGNVNLGLLVVASFNRVGGERYDYFGREFYRRGDPTEAPAAIAGSRDLGPAAGNGQKTEPNAKKPGLPLIGSEMFGNWLNTNPHSTGITRLRVDHDGNNGASLWAWGARLPQPAEWGMVPARLFSLNSGSQLAEAFSARYEADGMAVVLQANIKQGVLVVASFTEFKDGSGRSNYFHREFYYRS